MPRNISGVYTLPGGINPVVAGTPIMDSWANPTMDDLAAAMTDSLDRNGRGPMLAQLKTIAGSAATPAISQSSDLSSGLYFAAAQILASLSGNERLKLDVNTMRLRGITLSGGTPDASYDDFVLDTNASTAGFSILSLATGSSGYFMGNAAVPRAGGMRYSNFSDALIFRANNTDFLTLTQSGNLYGTALHNNAVLPSGATNQYIASGTYTPTWDSFTNITTATPSQHHWIRVGNVVIVFGYGAIDPAAGAALTQMDVSLPIASNLGSIEHLAGVAARGSTGATAPMIARITANAAGDVATLQYFNDADVSSRNWTYVFGYLVI
jgi:hypothetical protein